MTVADFYIAVGEQIRRQRLARGISQTELAERLRERPNAVSRWESGVYRPTLRDIDRIAAVLELSPLAFIPTRQGFVDESLRAERMQQKRTRR